MTTVKNNTSNADNGGGVAGVEVAPEATSGTQMSLEDVVSSIRFLLNMSHSFEQQDNLPESVKSAESALILRHAHDALITAALEKSQLTQEDAALLPRKISEQAKALVLRCNNYAVREFTARHFDAAAFFLNKALFLTDDGYEHTRHTAAGTTFLAPPTLSLVAAGTITSATTPRTSEAARRTAQKRPSSSNDGSASKKPKAGSRTPVKSPTSNKREKKKTATPRIRRAGQGRRTEAEKQASNAATVDEEKAATDDVQRVSDAAQVNQQGWVAACCFAEAEDERLSLRAATYNNLGCMERRRGQPQAALEYLRKAAILEQRVDQTGAGCAATYLNLCTVQNAVMNYDEAVVAAERAVAALQLLLLEQPLTSPPTTKSNNDDDTAMDYGARMRYVTMLIVAQYNLGVSLERRGRIGDDNLAKAAYRRVGELSRSIVRDNNVNTGTGGDLLATIEAALQAVRRIEAGQGNGKLHEDNAEKTNATEVAEHETVAAAQMQEGNAAAAGEEAAAALNVQSAHAADGSATNTKPVDTTKRKTSGELNSYTAAMPSLSQLPKLPSVVSSSSSSSCAVAPITNTTTTAAHPINSSTTTTRSSLSLPLCSATRATTAVHPSPEHDVSAGRLGGTREEQQPMLLAQDTASSASPPSNGSLKNNNNNSASRIAGGMPVRLPALPQSTTNIVNVPPPPLLPGALSTPDTNMTIAQPDLAHTANGQCQMCNASLSGPLRMLSISSSHSLPPLPNAVPAPPSTSQRSSMSERLSRLSAAAAQQRRNSRQNQSIASSQSFLLGLQANSANTNGSAKTRQLQDKVRLDIQRRQAAEQARAEAELADTIYEQLVKGMKEQNRLRCAKAAVQIQRMWRGVMTRLWLRQLLNATVKIQRYVRDDFLVRLREKQRQAALAEAAAREAQTRRETQACRLIQRRVRQFLRRLAIRRAYLARVRREFFAARCIQRGYRAARARRTARLLALAEQHRREDVLTTLRESIAARSIARAYRAYRLRCARIAAAEAERRRVHAAIQLQSLFRGVLTRAWFAYYKVQCRNAQVRSAQSQRYLTIVQAACRARLAIALHRTKQKEILQVCRTALQTRAALRLQCLWRCHVARIHYERLVIERAVAMRHAQRIQRWYRGIRARRAFAALCQARREANAAVCIQRWWHTCREQRKAREFARYHVALLRRQRLQRMQATAIVQLQAFCRARFSALLVRSVRTTRQKLEAVARFLQPFARGYADRRATADAAHFTRVCAVHAAHERQRQDAAAVIQRAWRAALAREALEQRRRAALAATRIAGCFRMYQAKQQRRARQAALRAAQEDRAARVLQRGLRAALRRRRVAENAAYYATQHRRAMAQRRRVEACTTIQALWRGYTTRRVLREEMAVMHEVTKHTITMQRRWRARCARDALRNEIQRRVNCRGRRTTAAITLQCFWRKMCAAERVARRRAQVATERNAALRLQCWWRRLCAQKERSARLKAQAESDALAAIYLELWHKSVTRINAFLRARASALSIREDYYKPSLLRQLSAQEQRYYRERHAAATRLQARYRGYRTRKLRAEAAAQAAAAAVAVSLESERRAQLAARRIQCALRQHLARATLARLRAAAEVDVMTTVVALDPHYAVRTAFLQYNTIHHRNVTAEREARDRRLHAAASVIQRAYRTHRARRAALATLRQMRATQAAWCIVRFWRQCRARRAGRIARRQAAAAVQLQRFVKGWQARRRWYAVCAAAAQRRRAEAALVAAKDRAAVVIQCAWRVRCARRVAALNRDIATQERRLRVCKEAVALIEEAYLNRLQQRRRRRVDERENVSSVEGQAQQPVVV